LKISLSSGGLSAANAERLAASTLTLENKAMRDSNICEILLDDARYFVDVIPTAA
jgi:hypothetical protein